MASPAKHQWIFRKRFRKGAYGWNSKTPIKRVKEAVSEIKQASKNDPVLGAEGAVIFLEKVSAALEGVDSSSGAIGNALNKAIEELVRIITGAVDAEDKVRDKWMERLYKAVVEDEIPYIELLPDFWGDMCVTKERASLWADRFFKVVRYNFIENLGYSAGIPVCLSSLLKAERYEELLDLLELPRHKFWHHRKFGTKALIAMGRMEDALSYAEDTRGLNESDIIISEACEEILLKLGRIEEAYRKYAIEANRKGTYLATFRSITKKYTYLTPLEIIQDLAKSTPGEEGKWFAAAKSARLYDFAIQIANSSPCDPKTLTRASGDLAEKEPKFAMEAGLAALRWLIGGYGYEVTNFDVINAYDNTLKSAALACRKEEADSRIKELMRAEGACLFVIKVLKGMRSLTI